MEKNSVKISDVKRVYTKSTDEKLRGFFACMKQVKNDVICAEALDFWTKKAEALVSLDNEISNEADKALKAEKRAKREPLSKEVEKARKAYEKALADYSRNDLTDVEAIQNLLTLCKRYDLTSACINREYLRENLPMRFNANDQLCTIKLVALEDENEVREAYKDFPDALREVDDKLYLYKPMTLFTANQFVGLFISASNAKKRALNAEALALTEAQKAEAEEKRIEAMRAKVLAYDAKREKAEASAEASK